MPGAYQALRVQRGSESTEQTWIEFRRRLGGFNSSITSGGHPTNGALAHLDNGLSGGPTQLVDFTPDSNYFCGIYYCQDFYDATLLVRQTFSNAYTNLNLTTVSASDSCLEVDVNYGPIPCTRQNPTVTLSPSSLDVDDGGNGSGGGNGGGKGKPK